MGWYPNVVDYPVSYYLMPYENGFNSRGLTGTLAIFLGGPYIKQDELATFIFVVLVLSYLFFSVLITKQAKSESDWRVGLFWVLLYLLSVFADNPHLMRFDGVNQRNKLCFFRGTYVSVASVFIFERARRELSYFLGQQCGIHLCYRSGYTASG